MTAAPAVPARLRPTPARRAQGLALLLLGAGAAHLAVPAPFDAMVPRSLPGPARRWTQASGVAELVVGAGVAAPRTRPAAALAAAGLFVAVFPANVAMARSWQRSPRVGGLATAGAWARLPLQVPLVAWALRVSREPR
ncbi:DoxX family protein [Rhodococcus aerolatus]